MIKTTGGLMRFTLRHSAILVFVILFSFIGLAKISRTPENLKSQYSLFTTPDLTVECSVTQSQQNINVNYSYDIVVTNNGTGDAQNIVISDTLPSGIVFVSATNGGTVSGNVITWPSVPVLSPGNSLSRSVTVYGTCTAVGNTTNAAHATNDYPDLNPDDNTDYAIVEIVDNVDPTITCPANITQDTDPGACTATVSLGTPTTNDNCGVASVTNDAP
ncbi:MAG: hypothetical protein C0593_14360, partial [Marinilabiliales bacterium]